MSWLKEVYKPIFPKHSKKEINKSSPNKANIYPTELRNCIGNYLANFYSREYQYQEGRLYKKSKLNETGWICVATLYGQDCYWETYYCLWNKDRK